MNAVKKRVLFLCIHNSARSQRVREEIRERVRRWVEEVEEEETNMPLYGRSRQREGES
jgi:hypothetical protein